MTRIIVSVSGNNFQESAKALEGAEYAELRLDLVKLTEEEIISLMQMCNNWIVAVRKEFLSISGHTQLFQIALNQKPMYVDFDFSLITVPHCLKLMQITKDAKCPLIFSYHNFENTPATEELEKITDKIFESGADITKIACMVNNEKDGERLSGLYNKFENIIAFGMGEHGVKSRIQTMFLGNGFAYAAPDFGNFTAPGQLRLSEMKELFNTKNE